jgi:quinoprotein glucose dehydrogenase
VHRQNAVALWLYALLVLCTLIWAVAEAGFDFWALAPRLDVLVIVGVWLVLPFVLRVFSTPARQGALALGVTLVLSGIALVYAAFNDPQEINGTVTASANATTKSDGNWLAYGSTQGGTRYSSLAQITDKTPTR